MRQWIGGFFFLFLSLLTEMSALSLYWNIYIPFSLIALIYLSCRHGEILGEVLGFSLGIILDNVTGVPLGFYSFSYVIIGYVCGLLREVFYRKSFIFYIALFILSETFIFFISLFLDIFFSVYPWQPSGAYKGILSGIVAIPIYINFLEYMGSLFYKKYEKI